MIDERHGLSVWGGQLQPQSYLSNVHMSQLPRIDEFTNFVCEAFAANLVMSEQQCLALELYGLSNFESSDRARFLILITCVEALCTREPRAGEQLKVISSLVQVIQKAVLSPSERESLLSVLGEARFESIGKACRRLVKGYLGENAKKRFQELYDLRSTILHTGTCSSRVNIESAAFDLNYLLSSLFRKMFL